MTGSLKTPRVTSSHDPEAESSSSAILIQREDGGCDGWGGAEHGLGRAEGGRGMAGRKWDWEREQRQNVQPKCAAKSGILSKFRNEVKGN